MILLLGYTSLIYWTRFSCGYGWLGLHIWQWMIRYCLIFWSTIHLMPYWGIFPFQLRFVDLHGVIWSSSLMRYTPRQWPVCYLIMISQGILSWAIQLGSHFSTFSIITFLLLGDASLICWSNSAADMDGWDYTLGDGLFGAIWFFWSTAHLMDDDLFVILSWSPRRASFRSSSQAHTFRHWDIIMFLLLRDTSLICWSYSATDMDG